MSVFNRSTDPRPKLVRVIQQLATLKGWSREQMAALADDAASQMSRLMTNYWQDFSTDRLPNRRGERGQHVRIR